MTTIYTFLFSHNVVSCNLTGDTIITDYTGHRRAFLPVQEINLKACMKLKILNSKCSVCITVWIQNMENNRVTAR